MLECEVHAHIWNVMGGVFFSFVCPFSLFLSFLGIAAAEFTVAKWRSLISPSPNALCIGYVSGFPDEIPPRTLANNSPEAIGEDGEVPRVFFAFAGKARRSLIVHRKFLPANSTFRYRTREKAIVSTENTVRAQKFTTADCDRRGGSVKRRYSNSASLPPLAASLPPRVSFEASWIII